MTTESAVLVAAVVGLILTLANHLEQKSISYIEQLPFFIEKASTN